MLNNSFSGEYSEIPEYMRDTILDYVQKHIRPGGFISAVICNNLKDAVGYADQTNLPLLSLYVKWFYNKAPIACYGSPEKMNNWLKNKE